MSGSLAINLLCVVNHEEDRWTLSGRYEEFSGCCGRQLG